MTCREGSGGTCSGRARTSAARLWRGLGTALSAAASLLLLAYATAGAGELTLASLGQGGVSAWGAAAVAEASEVAGSLGVGGVDTQVSPSDEAAELLEFEGDVPVGVKAAAEETLSYAPAEALRAMGEQGWKVVFTGSRDLREFVATAGAAEPLGVTVWADKRVYVKATVGCASTTTLHEVSHWIDRESGWPSSSEEWLAAYEAERGAYASVSAYAAADAREMFAEVCDDVLLGRLANTAKAQRCAEICGRVLAQYGHGAEEG